MTTISKPVVVVTGFEPFGERKKVNLNASWTVADYIRKKRTGNKKVELKAMELKVAWESTYELGKEKEVESRYVSNNKPFTEEIFSILTTRASLIYRPDIWIAFGEDSNSSKFQIELKADPKNFKTKEEYKKELIKKYNCSATAAEKEAKKIAIPPNVKNKYPKKDRRKNSVELCRELKNRLNNMGYPTKLSRNADGYICEQMLYTLLSVRTGHKKLSFFIHVPTGNKMKAATLKSFGLEVFDYVVNTLYPKI